jgi:putative ABC transport system substrate-binding protein
MRRRDFIVGLGGAVSMSFVARTQQTMPVIGFLSSLSANDAARITSAFQKGLNEAGYVQGQNVALEYRFAEGRYDKLPDMAADLVRRQVTIIAAISGTPAGLAAKAATETIPIVFAMGSDPVTSNLVTALNRPGRNVTGATFFTAPLATKRLEIVRQLLPKVTTIGVLVNPTNPPSALEGRNVPSAAQTIGLATRVLNASTPSQIDDAFASLVREPVDALYVSADPMFLNQRNQLIALTARHAVFAIYADREIAEAGGLISYGASRSDAYRQAGLYVGRILKGEKPGDLPVVLPTKFELIINLKTARTQGVDIPATVLAIADEVIE